MSKKNKVKYGRDYKAIAHLEYWKDKPIDEETYLILRDFKNFLLVAWRYLGLPPPTPIQYLVADYLQGNISYEDLSDSDIPVEDLTGDVNGAGFIIAAYRGFGKSWITGAYCLWLLLRIPYLEITVASASEDKCVLFIAFVKDLMKLIPFCSHLYPDSNCVNNKTMVDTPLHKPSQSNSLAAIPIMANKLTGRRSDVIIGDDLEVPNNSTSMLKRDKLAERVTEFEAILGDVPEDGKIKFKQKVLLGTPQTQETLYMRLVKENGYTMRIWPSRYPNHSQMDRIGHLLCPILQDRITRGVARQDGYGLRFDMGEPTDTRFTDSDLNKKELGYGYTGYQLQYQLDPSLSDLAKFPLKLSDLMVTDLNIALGYDVLTWTSNVERTINDLPSVGFAGDNFRECIVPTNHMSKYEDSVICVDPSSGGAGKDETTYAIGKILNGYIFVFEVGGFLEGPQSQATMDGIASLAKKYECSKVVVESNQGLGMFQALLRPALQRVKYNVEIEDYRAVGQKEPRIIQTLEPVMNNHRLVFDRNFIKTERLPEIDGMKDDMKQQYSLFYQMTRLENEKNCLPKDDRIDVLHMLVKQFQEDIDVNAVEEMVNSQNEILQMMLDRPMIKDNGYEHSTVRLFIDGKLDSLDSQFDEDFSDIDMLDLD